jgi:SAM-dependent methyltransferase
MLRTVKEEQNRYKRYIHIDPTGFTHNMRPSSVEKLLNHIGHERIQNSRVLEVGCGQGYLVSHLLNGGASHVIGTDIESSILSTIPLDAFQIYRDQGKTVDFRVESFENTPMDIEVDIITMFIGANHLVVRLLDLFVQNPHVKTIAFMKPARGKAEIENKMNELIYTYNLTSKTFQIHLSVSNEQRKAVVMKKIPVIDLTNDSPSTASTSLQSISSNSSSSSIGHTNKKRKIPKLNRSLGLTKRARSHIRYSRKVKR